MRVLAHFGKPQNVTRRVILIPPSVSISPASRQHFQILPSPKFPFPENLEFLKIYHHLKYPPPLLSEFRHFQFSIMKLSLSFRIPTFSIFHNETFPFFQNCAIFKLPASRVSYECLQFSLIVIEGRGREPRREGLPPYFRNS